MHNEDDKQGIGCLAASIFIVPLGTVLLGLCIRGCTSLNYIDGGASKPVTPHDQAMFLVADVLLWGAMPVGIILWLLCLRKTRVTSSTGNDCPKCGYDLRVASGRRCPECGYRLIAPPLSAFKQQPETDETVPVSEAVHHALNDIDRKLYPPVETLHKRHDALVAAYEEVGHRFKEDAEAVGLSDWLRYTVLSRILSISTLEPDIDTCRKLFDEMEQLGHPTVDALISERMAWANLLAERDQPDEANLIARQLDADVKAYRRLHPDVLVAELAQVMHEFRQRHGV